MSIRGKVYEMGNTEASSSTSLLKRWMNGSKYMDRANKFIDVDEAAFAMEIVSEEKSKPSPQRKNNKSSSNNAMKLSSSKPTANPEVAYRRVVSKKKIKSYPSKQSPTGSTNNTSSSSFHLFGLGRSTPPSMSTSKTSSSSFSPNSSTSVTSGRLQKLQIQESKEGNTGNTKTPLLKQKSSKESSSHSSDILPRMTTRTPSNISQSSRSSHPPPPLPVIETPVPFINSVANFSKPVAKRHSSEKLLYARSVLSRPFFLELDRPTIPTTPWIIHVSPVPTHFHEDGIHGIWKYTVTLRPKVYADFSKHSPPGTSVQRSLQDFLWLESALAAEYDGSLLGPSLALAIAQPPTPEDIFTTASTWPIPIHELSSSYTVAGIDNNNKLSKSGTNILPSNHHGLVTSTTPNNSNSMNNQNLEQGHWDPAIEARQLLDRALYYASHPIPGISRGSEQDQSQQLPGILLQYWLQDILNGTRARGEFYIPSSVEAKSWIQSLGWKTRNKFEEVVINVTESEAWEIFFYRKTDEDGESLSKYFDNEEKRKRIVQEEFVRLIQRGFVPISTSSKSNHTKRSFFSSLMDSPCSMPDPLSLLRNKNTPDTTSPSSCASPITIMGNNLPKFDTNAHPFAESILSQRWSVHQRLGKILFHKHNLQPRDFLTAFDPRSETPWYTELVETQKYITFFQREYTLQVMYRLRLLIEHELVISAAWKRFAISLSNIYACEQEMEKINIGTPFYDQHNDDVAFMPHRHERMRKSEFDDALRVYVKQKSDRALPSLRVLNQGVYSHYIDVCSVDASLISMDTANMETKEFIPSDENLILMQSRLRRVNQSLNIRTARMAWIFFSIEARQAELLSSAAKSLHARLPMNSSFSDNLGNTEDDIDKLEDLVKRLVNLARPFLTQSPSLNGGNSISSQPLRLDEDEVDSIDDNNSQLEEVHQRNVEETCRLVRECGGIWDINVTNIILESIGIDLTDSYMDQLSSHAKAVHKLSQNFRQALNRCNDALDLLEDCLVGETDDKNNSLNHRQITKMRLHLLSSMSRLFCSSTVSMMRENRSSRWVTDYRPTKSNLEKIGVELVDVYGWLYSNEDDNELDDDEYNEELRTDGNACCGQIALQYIQDVREREFHTFIRDVRRILCEYEELLVKIESFIYISAVGILSEKHYSKLRTDCLQAWEKKTDIITAINVATKKRLNVVVQELEGKLDEFDPSVSHSGVKEAKDRHLASKSVKSELEALATKQFLIMRRSCIDKVHDIIRLWTRYDESSSEEEIIPLRNFVREVEASTRDEDIQSDGGYHLIASFVLNTNKSSTTRIVQ